MFLGSLLMPNFTVVVNPNLHSLNPVRVRIYTRRRSVYRLLIKWLILLWKLIVIVLRIWNEMSETVRNNKSNSQLYYSYRLAVINYLNI